MDRTMDGEICSWIIEFLLRRSGDDMLVKKLIQAVPSLHGNPRLNKTLLLHSIKTEIAAGNVSEKILDYLEMIEGIDRGERVTIPGSMKRAYCAVALECTAKNLVGSRSGKGKYLDAVKRVWRERIENLEKSKVSKLVSEELRRLRRWVEDAVADEDVAGALIAINTRNDAILSLRVYMREALSLMGQPFIERQCELFLDREYGSDPGAL